METQMNSNAATTSTHSVTAKRVVSLLLIGMLVVTAAFGVDEYLANANGVTVFFWLMTLLALGSFWLRLALNEHDYLEGPAGLGFRANYLMPDLA